MLGLVAVFLLCALVPVSQAHSAVRGSGRQQRIRQANQQKILAASGPPPPKFSVLTAAGVGMTISIRVNPLRILLDTPAGVVRTRIGPVQVSRYSVVDPGSVLLSHFLRFRMKLYEDQALHLSHPVRLDLDEE